MIKNILYLSVLTTIIVIAAVGLSIYHSLTTNTISSDTSIQITQIPSSFDTQTVADIKNRKVIPVNLSSDILQQATPAGSIVPTVSPAPTPGGINPLTTPTPPSLPLNNSTTSSASASPLNL